MENEEAINRQYAIRQRLTELNNLASELEVIDAAAAKIAIEDVMKNQHHERTKKTPEKQSETKSGAHTETQHEEEHESKHKVQKKSQHGSGTVGTTLAPSGPGYDTSGAMYIGTVSAPSVTIGNAQALTIDSTTTPPTVNVNGLPVTTFGNVAVGRGLWLDTGGTSSSPILFIGSLGTLWTFLESYSSGTVSPTIPATTWTARALNSTSRSRGDSPTNIQLGVSPATANQLLINQTGDYVVTAYTQGSTTGTTLGVKNPTNHITRIQKVNGTPTTLLVGSSTNDAVGNQQIASVITGWISVTSVPTIIELQDWFAGPGGNGGVPITSGLAEVYTQLMIQQVA